MIIIGTGAGGGTLAHRLAPSGKRILLLERGGYLPREPENWDSRGGLQPGPLPLRRATGIDKRRRAVPARTSSTSSAATRSSTARSCSACASATSSEVRHYGGVSPAWPISYADLEPYYTEAERLYLVHGAGAARTRPSRSRSGPFPHPAVSHEPRIQQLARRLRAHGPPPVPPAGRRRPRRVRPRGGPLRALRPLRRLPVPDRRQGRRARAAACGRRSSTRTSRCARTRACERLETDAAGGTVTEVVVDRRGARGALQRRRRRRLLRRDQLRGAAAALGVRPAPERARELAPTRSAATTWRTSTPA